MRVLSVPNTKDKISCSLNSFPKDDRNLAADSIATPCGLHAPLITPGPPVTRRLYYQVNFVLAAAYSQISQPFFY